MFYGRRALRRTKTGAALANYISLCHAGEGPIIHACYVAQHAVPSLVAALRRTVLLKKLYQVVLEGSVGNAQTYIKLIKDTFWNSLPKVVVNLVEDGA